MPYELKVQAGTFIKGGTRTSRMGSAGTTAAGAGSERMDVGAPPSRRARVVRRRPDRGVPLAVAGVSVLAFALVAGGLASGWYGLSAPSSASGCVAGLTVEGAGASFPSALLSNWAGAYAGSSGNRANYQSSGAGEGISLLANALVDYAVTDEPLNASEQADLTGNLGGMLTLPFLGGAVVVVYRLPGVAGPINLTGADLADVYLGSITSWNDPRLVADNPALASVNTPITPVHRTDPAGMTWVLTSYLSAASSAWANGSGLGVSLAPAWPPLARQEGAAGNAQMLREVAALTGAIGYTDLFDASAAGLATASLENPSARFVAPSVASTAAAVNDLYAAHASGFPTPEQNWSSVSWVDAPGTSDYPLVAMAYYLVPDDPSRGYTASLAFAAALVEWLTYTLTTGLSFDAVAFPFVPPPPALVAADLGATANMTYAGQSLPACG